MPHFDVVVPRMDPLFNVSMNVESPNDFSPTLRMSLSRVLTEHENDWLGAIKGNLFSLTYVT